MPSFLARLRAISHSTTSSSVSEPIATPETPQTALPIVRPLEFSVKRKAVPDLNVRAELDDLGFKDVALQYRLGIEAEHNPAPVEGLRPSPVRVISADWDHETVNQDAGQRPSLELPSTGRESLHGSDDLSPSSRPVYEFLSRPPMGSSETWSTFGRRRNRRRSSLAQITEQSRTRTPSSEKNIRGGSLRSTRKEVHSSKAGTSSVSQSSPGRSGSRVPSRKSSGQWSASQHESSDNPGSAAGTLSSCTFHHLQYAAGSQSAPALTGPLSSLRLSAFSPPQQSCPEDAERYSPEELQRYTPSGPSVEAFSPTSASTPFASPSSSNNRLQAQQTRFQSFPAFMIDTQEPRNVLAQESNDKSKSSLFKANNFMQSVSFPSMPFTFGRFTRHEPKRTNTSDIDISFNRSSNEGVHASQADKSTAVPRLEMHNEHERRASARQSAQEALRGVVAGDGEYGWPADVSREMVLLALRRRQPENPSRHSAPAAEFNTPALPVLRDSHVFSSRPVERDQEQGAARLAYPSFPSSSSFSHLEGAVRGRALSDSFQQQGTAASHPDLLRSGESDGLRLRQRLGQHTSAEDIKRHHSFEQDPLDMTANGAAAIPSTGQLDTVKPDQPSGILIGKSSQHSLSSRAVSSSLGVPAVNITAATPQGSLGRSSHHNVEDNSLSVPLTSTPAKSEKSQGKRKAEESEDGSPPGSKPGLKTTFAVEEKRGNRPSNTSSSHAPSSFQSLPSRKRVRLSSPMTAMEESRPGSSSNHGMSGSWPRRGGSRHSAPPSPPRTPSRQGHSRAASRADASVISTGTGRQSNRRGDHDARSLSHVSIPISAIVSPHVPSVDRLSNFHMRDPRKPPKKRSTGWGLRFRSAYDPGSPIPAWAFWLGFLFPPLWLVASFWRIPKTRMVGELERGEKAITVDDPQIEHDARNWRFRCQVMSVVFFFTYAPVIVLLAVFVPRS